ncbi:MAG: DUF2785 domain-containing protein [Halanaerobiales bacterium]|nr:DUF2785 domain-containing protein [Halanaerobiales bacterium]
MKLDELKTSLQKIVENEYKIRKKDDYLKLTDQMLDNIGVVDPKLRDDLIYLVLANWILDDLYNNQELVNILDTCLDQNHLFYKLKNRGDDSVFTRTFSALIIAVLINKDNKQQFLDKKKFLNTVNKTIKYYKEEKDLRGYIDNKGWAHSVAHGADIMDEIANNDKISPQICEDILNVISLKIQISNYTYINGEDERMAQAVYSILTNKVLDSQKVNKWFKELVDINKLKNRNEYDRLIFNIKSFLKSLYFKILSDQDLNNKNLILITDSLKEISKIRFL